MHIKKDHIRFYPSIYDKKLVMKLSWWFIRSPKTVFIMGGGEGSAAREALRHKSIDKVVMCDIDQVKYVRVYVQSLLLLMIIS